MSVNDCFLSSDFIVSLEKKTESSFVLKDIGTDRTISPLEGVPGEEEETVSELIIWYNCAEMLFLLAYGQAFVTVHIVIFKIWVNKYVFRFFYPVKSSVVQSDWWPLARLKCLGSLICVLMCSSFVILHASFLSSEVDVLVWQRRKSKKEVMSEIISKSKYFKVIDHM